MKKKEKNKKSLKTILFKSIITNKILSIGIIIIVSLLITIPAILIIKNSIKDNYKNNENSVIKPINKKDSKKQDKLVVKLKEITIDEVNNFNPIDFIESLSSGNSQLHIKEVDGKYLVYSDESLNESNLILTDEDTSSLKSLGELKIDIINDNEQDINEIGEHIIKIKITFGDLTIQKETKLIVNEKQEEQVINNEPINYNVSSNPTSYSDNIVVQRALSQVGQTGVRCTELVEYAIQGIGKTLWVNETIWHNMMNSEDVDRDKAYSNHSFDITNRSTSGGKYIGYANNNILTKVEFCNHDGTSCTDVSDGWDFYGKVIGGEVYEERTFWSYLSPANIFKYGTEIDISAVQPGDVIYYNNGGSSAGVDHVAIYIGNGQAVHGGVYDSMNVMIMSIYVNGASNPRAFRLN